GRQGLTALKPFVTGSRQELKVKINRRKSIVLEFAVFRDRREIFIYASSCLNMTVKLHDVKEMWVNSIVGGECSGFDGVRFTGNELLQVTEKLAEYFNVNFSKLDDTSSVLVRGREIKLAPLRIFLYGESWYQKYGYLPMPVIN